jgi:hypothetical protein
VTSRAAKLAARVVVVLANPATAAAESCVYDPVSKRIAAEVTPGAQAMLEV